MESISKTPVSPRRIVADHTASGSRKRSAHKIVAVQASRQRQTLDTPNSQPVPNSHASSPMNSPMPNLFEVLLQQNGLLPILGAFKAVYAHGQLSYGLGNIEEEMLSIRGNTTDEVGHCIDVSAILDSACTTMEQHRSSAETPFPIAERLCRKNQNGYQWKISAPDARSIAYLIQALKDTRDLHLAKKHASRDTVIADVAIGRILAALDPRLFTLNDMAAIHDLKVVHVEAIEISLAVERMTTISLAVDRMAPAKPNPPKETVATKLRKKILQNQQNGQAPTGIATPSPLNLTVRDHTPA